MQCKLEPSDVELEFRVLLYPRRNEQLGRRPGLRLGPVQVISGHQFAECYTEHSSCSVCRQECW